MAKHLGYFNAAAQASLDFRNKRISRIMEHFGCSREAAERVVQLRDDGYSMCQAALMAGVTDPSDSQES